MQDCRARILSIGAVFFLTSGSIGAGTLVHWVLVVIVDYCWYVEPIRLTESGPQLVTRAPSDCLIMVGPPPIFRTHTIRRYDSRYTEGRDSDKRDLVDCPQRWPTYTHQVDRIHTSKLNAP
ncbi:uncharacterized protein BO72DRAFT_188379 [Aspergillus fijiensis CBS 313.89]|uniref:Uncharacterized protein n=1 Tax=Aspergillus fijiensis CBS 313.89 TaxID=1448319 RepID=A0A8G1RJ54_9EURO|nr:uncharacterized protein BO72DRAFT_188379 [Aspergillus fijiensis CBS 313.89]RAK74947.1 hypothetical protein BO72DRAFT_188379 [Aspergillus fijiensis CBS 313.89]